jgi:DNA-binding HxlR family transcriptional regulator
MVETIQEMTMRWDEIGQQTCSVARALSVVGERWTLLILRDAFLGTRRFDRFQHDLGITRHRLSERLTKLVEHGVLVKVQYHDRPVRHEYRLTRKGLALYPVLMSLGQWGNEWMDNGEGVPLEYIHQSCGKATEAVLTCSECGEILRPEKVETRLGSPLKDVAALMENEGNRAPSIPQLLSHLN